MIDSTELSYLIHIQKFSSLSNDIYATNIMLAQNGIPSLKVGNLNITLDGWNWYYNGTYETGVVSELPIFLNKGTEIYLSDYTNAKFYVGWRVNGTYYRQGWIENGKFTCPVDAEYVINIQSKDASIQTNLALGHILTIVRPKACQCDKISVYNPFKSKPYYGHIAVNDFFKDGSGNNIVANNSLDEIQLTARLGFEWVELKPKVTSDGKYIVIHGENSCFSTSVYSLDGADITNTRIGSVTLQYIKDNIRYNSVHDKYKTPIPTLEEALIACNENHIGALVETTNDELVEICLKYMSQDRLILYSPPADVRTKYNYSGFIFHWFNSQYTKEEMLNVAYSYGAPFIAGVGNQTISYQGMDGFKETVDAFHNKGFLVSVAARLNSLRDLFRIGVDACASNYEVNPFEANYDVFDVDTMTGIITNGVVNNKTIILEAGQTVECGRNDIISLGKAYLLMKFNGSINIVFGCSGAVRNVTSDGNNTYFDSDYIMLSNSKIIITADSRTTITMFNYKTSKC